MENFISDELQPGSSHNETESDSDNKYDYLRNLNGTDN